MDRYTGRSHSVLLACAILLVTGFSPIPALHAQQVGIELPDREVSGLRLLALTSRQADQEEEYASLPWKAALASLALPGSGQILTGRSWGWGLIATEAVLIGSGLWARHEGRGLKGEYERFADLNWERDRYLEYLTTFESLTGSPWPHDHHTLPPADIRDHDYYEMIGKYDQFAPGWTDWHASWDVPWRGVSRSRERYLNRRFEANRYLKWSLTAGGLVFLNHLAAGTEVLFSGGEPSGNTHSRSRELTPWGAAARSLLFPGWGQRLQGKRGLAGVLTLCEGMFWGGLKAFSVYSDWMLDDSRRWAVSHAGADPWLKDSGYYRVLALYPDFTTYNAVQRSGLGSPSEAYPAGIGYEWRWDSESSWKRYRELRRDSRLAENRAKIALSGIVAGRLVGAVAALITGTLREPQGGPAGPVSGSAGRNRLTVTISPWMADGVDTSTGVLQDGRISGVTLKLRFF